jgi:hypothetical protein
VSKGSIFRKILIFALVVLVGIYFLYLLHIVWALTVSLVLGLGIALSGIVRCYSCHKKIGVQGMFRDTFDREFILTNGYQPPNKMSKYDEICKSCLDDITTTQVQNILEKQRKYKKELSVILNVFGVWNLGWRYGIFSLVINGIMAFGMINLGIFLTEQFNHTYTSEPDLVPVSAMIAVILILPFYCMINWYFIKKYNARVRVSSNLNDHVV